MVVSDAEQRPGKTVTRPLWIAVRDNKSGRDRCIPNLMSQRPPAAECAQIDELARLNPLANHHLRRWNSLQWGLIFILRASRGL